MKYSVVLVLSVTFVMVSNCCPIDSEIEMLDWLDNPEASLRDLKQETEDMDWLDSPFVHFSDVRRANYAEEKKEQFFPSQIKKMEEIPAEQVKPNNDPYAFSSILMNKEMQAPEQVAQAEQRPEKFLGNPVDQHLLDQFGVGGKEGEVQLVSQDQQKPLEEPVDEINSEQLPTEKKFDRMNHQHRHTRPTLPALIPVERRPDAIPVVLEQVTETEQKPELFLIGEQNPDKFPAKEKKSEQIKIEEKDPEKVLVLQEQVPADKPQPDHVLVENQKPEQVLFDQEKPKNALIPVDQHKSQQAVGTETSGETQVGPVKKQMPSTIPTVSTHNDKPKQSSPIHFETSGCFWSGTAPFCLGKCGELYRTKMVNKTGDGMKCLIGIKKLCCPIDLTSLIG